MDIFSKLPKIPFLSKTQESVEYFFALNIYSDKVAGAVWGIEGRKLRIINTAEATFSSLSELIEAANLALDEALADFTPEPEKVLFGVPDSWLQDEDLKEEYLKLLRKLVKELEITPMAFVSTTSGVCHMLQKSQGVPATAILVEVASSLVINVVKAGKVLASRNQKRSGDLPNDIERALLTISDVEVLPSKILLFGDKNLNRFKEEMISFPWMSQLPFLHLPKIETLDDQMAIKAICFAGASELSPELNLSPNNIVLDSLNSLEKGSLVKPILEEGGDIQEVGFVAGDVQKQQEDLEETAFGMREVFPSAPKLSEEAGDIYSGVTPQEKQTFIEKMEGLWGKFFTGRFFRNKALLIFVVVLLLVVLAAVFLPKATVTVFIDMRTLEKDAQIIADPALKSVDEGGKKIPGKVVEIEESGTGKATATGKKKVGDPARGTVVIYNKTSSPRTFSAGTVLQGSNSLAFALDSSVTVASSSGVEGGIAFGKTSANVTASVIGPDSNLGSGQELSFKGLSSSDYSAKVDQALSGGVSKDVTVVTLDDQKKLLAQVTSELRNKAKDDIQAKLTGDMKVLADGLSETVTKSTYSKNVNDQASDFSLTVSAKYKGTSYNEGDLKMIVSKLVEVNVPEGYELDLAKTETQADVSKIEKDGRLIFSAKFKAKLMPKFDKEVLKKDIAGRSLEEAVNRLKTIENVIGSNIVIVPNLPAPIQRLPILSRNITLEVTAK